MKKEKPMLWRVVMIAILYLLIRNWADFKHGFIDGINDGYQTAHHTSAK